MTIQWTLVAGLLYAEIALVILLLLPFLSPSIWQRFFKSRVCEAFAAKANLYSSIVIAALVLFFLDSVREMHKYSGGLAEPDHGRFDNEMQLNLKLFRSQRNYYIAGFALFLNLVIRRLIILISCQATMQKENEAIMRQAQSATETAEKLLREKEQITKRAMEAAENIGNTQREKYEKELNEIKDKLIEAEQELNEAKVSLSMKQNQASAVSKEYEILMKEHASLKLQLEHNAENSTESAEIEDED